MSFPFPKRLGFFLYQAHSQGQIAGPLDQVSCFLFKWCTFVIQDAELSL